MHQPPGFVDRTHPDFVCRLRKSLYGLKQAPRSWYHRFAMFISSKGFQSVASDQSLFVYRRGNNIAYMQLYVDDIVLTASKYTFLNSIIHTLSAEFAMTKLGRLHHFLGIQVIHTTRGLFLSQSQYVNTILERANMTDCNAVATLVETTSKLNATAGKPLKNDTLY